MGAGMAGGKAGGNQPVLLIIGDALRKDGKVLLRIFYICRGAQASSIRSGSSSRELH